MNRYVILCGSAPNDFRQKKLIKKYDFLISDEGNAIPAGLIVIFPNGVPELLLEATLNDVLDKAAGEKDGSAPDGSTSESPCAGANEVTTDEILLYICAQTKEDLDALSEYEAVGFGRLPVVRLGGEEIRKEVIEYYEDLAHKTGVSLRVEYEADDDFIAEEELGWEKVSPAADFLTQGAL